MENNGALVAMGIVLVAILALGVGTMISSQPADIQPSEEDVDGYFESFGLDVADIDSDFKPQYFDSVTPVSWDSDGDVDTQGSATYERTGGEDIYDLRTGVLHFDVDDYVSDAETVFEYSESDNLSDETVEIAEYKVYDYDEPSEPIVDITDTKLSELNEEEEVSLGALEGGEYAVEIAFEVSGEDVDSGKTDTIGELEMELDADDADSDDPLEIGEFPIEVDGQ